MAGHEAAFDATRTDRDRTLRATRRFEARLAMASGGDAWLPSLMTDLEALRSAMAEELHELDRPDSLLAMIAADNPRRFGPRVRGIRDQYDDVLRQVGSLWAQLAGIDDADLDPMDLRQRARWITTALHHCRARQTDLVFEALSRDLGNPAN